MKTKKDVIAELANMTGMSKTDASEFLNAFIKIIYKSLLDGELVKLTGFGKFFVSENKKKFARNPLTGAQVPIKNKYLPKFKAGANFRKILNFQR